MTTIPVQLPDDVRLFAENYAKRKGFDTVNDFISSLVAEAKERHGRLEKQLLDGIDSGLATIKTTEDWDQMRSRVARKSVS